MYEKVINLWLDKAVKRLQKLHTHISTYTDKKMFYNQDFGVKTKNFSQKNENINFLN